MIIKPGALRVCLSITAALAGGQLHSQVPEWLAGTAPENGIFFLPVGYHTQYERRVTRNDLAGAVYRSVAVGTFVNSFDDRSWFLVWLRRVVATPHFEVEYFAGVVGGYRGRLQETTGIPFRKTFLWRGDVNPVVSLNLGVVLAPNLRLQMMVSPLMTCTGIKYSF